MISLKNVSVDYTDFILDNISLEIGEGEFFVLMGPTGAGKTVLLEAVAGLTPLSKGEIFVDDRKISSIPPEKRGIGLVYQDYALFPHMTVDQNIRFGLRYRGRTGPFQRRGKHHLGEWEQEYHRLVDILDLQNLLHRKPATLSGGEAQRTALARALIMKPQLLLLDEPLSALDTRFREEIRHHLREVHAATETTFLMVTHDFHDALALGTKAAVIHNGRIEQTGHIKEIFRKPATRFVADFVGMVNVIEADIDGERGVAVAGGSEIILMANTVITTEAVRRRQYIAIRPEDIVLSRKELQSSMRNHFWGKINSIQDHGIAYEVHCMLGELELISHVTRGALVDLELEEGMDICVSWKAAAVHIL